MGVGPTCSKLRSSDAACRQRTMPARAHPILVLHWGIAGVINGISLPHVSVVMLVCHLMLRMELVVLFRVMLCSLLCCHKSFNIFTLMLDLQFYSQVLCNCFILTTHALIVMFFTVRLTSDMLLWSMTWSLVHHIWSLFLRIVWLIMYPCLFMWLVNLIDTLLW